MINDYIVHWHLGGDLRVAAHSVEQAKHIVKEAIKDGRIDILQGDNMTSFSVHNLADYPTLGEP